MEILSKFSERLSELMFEKNIKSEMLGKEIGINGSTIRRYLRGYSRIKLTNLLILADYFNCSIDFLAGRSEEVLTFQPKKQIPSFPQRLRQIFTEKGMTRYSLDKNTKFKDSYLYSWDHGAVPDIYTLIELAEIFDCSIDYLVGRDR